MLASTDKLRGLVLAALLVLSTVGGVVTLSGSAAAAGNDVGITSAVEAEGTVEVIFNTSTFSDPPESSDVDIWIDGTRVVDDGASDTNLGGQEWSISGFTRSGQRATFTIETDDSRQDIDPNRNLTVEFEGVARSGATNTDPETEVTVTQAVVTEGGSDDTVDNAQRIYQGDDIAIEATSTDADVFLNTTGVDVSTGTDSRYITVSTESFTTGKITEVEFDGDPNNVQYFEVQDLGLTATATDTSITDETALTVDVSSNRGGVPLTATLLDGDDTEVETITRDFPGDGTATLDFGTQSAGDGPYTVRVVDNETNASATTSDITVTEARPIGIDRAVEAGGDVEVVFNTSTFNDPPESGDVNLWVDGTRVVDGGASDTNLGEQSWTISGFTQSGRSASFTVQTDGSTQDIAANRNLTVEFEEVTRSGDNPDPEARVTTTQAVVTEGGSANTESNAQQIYGGDPVAVEAGSTDADVFVASTGQALRTGPDSNLLTVSTQSLPSGISEIQFDGDETNDQFVDLDDLGLTATATDTSIDDGTALTVDVGANRGDEPFTATLLDEGGTEVETTTGTLDATTATEVDFGTQSGGSYTVRVADNATNASATTDTITVGSSGSGGGGSGGTDADDSSEVIYDPAEIATLVDLPEGVEPVAGERAPVLLASEGTAATFTGDAAVTYVGFDGSTSGEVAVAELNDVETGTAPVGGTVVTAARISVSGLASGTDGTVRIRVPARNLDDAGAIAEDLQLVRFVDGEWTTVNTTTHSQSDGDVVIEARMDPDAIVAVRAAGSPAATVELSEMTVEPGEPVVLDGSESTTQYGDLVAHAWSVDGQRMNGSVATVSFDETGRHTVELTVTNDAGETATETATVTVASGGAASSEPAVDEETPTAGSGPGFGAAVAVGALVGAGLLTRRFD